MLKILVALVALSSSAYAFDNGQYESVDPKIRHWFKNVRSPNGIPCCDIADGHSTTWRRSETPGYEYDVPIESNWTPVPSEAIVKNSNNPTGEAIVWYVKQMGNSYYIRCFVLGSGS